MNILFVLTIGFDKGGPSVHLLTDVIENALQQGHSCHVVLKKTVSGDATGLERLTEAYNGLTVSLIADVKAKKGGFVKRYLDDCRYARKCKQRYKKGSYDAVFLQSCNVGWVHMRCLKKLKAPIVFNIQDIFPQNLMFSGQLPMAKITYPLFCRLQKIAYQKANRLITISEDMKQTLVEQGINGEKIEVVYNWSYGDGRICLENIPQDRICDLHTKKDRLNVVYAGNIGKMQNVELIAKTAAVSKADTGIHYYIIGDGANKKRVETLTEGLPNVTLLPMQPSEYAESIYAQADVNLVPLAKGGIKTALPSKTATVLRTDAYAVFCIDPNSRFETLVEAGSRIRVTGNEDPQDLYRVLCELKNQSVPTTGDTTLPKVFSRENAGRYVALLAGEK